jgi:tetratricopeptide (TPR) repeat protein
VAELKHPRVHAIAASASGERDAKALRAAFETKDWATAERLSRALVDAAPLGVDGHVSLAAALYEQRRLTEAAASCRHALQLAPTDASAHLILAKILRRMGDIPGAIDACERSVELAHHIADGHRLLGKLLWEAGRPHAARDSLERAFEMCPEDVGTAELLGYVWTELGSIDRADSVYRSALQFAPGSAVIHYAVARLKTFESPDDADLRALEKLASGGPDVDVPRRDALLFALAKAYDDLGEWDRAFEALREGNELYRRNVDYDSADVERATDGIIRVFDSRLVERLSNTGHESQRSIFIFGMPRSGTTLVEQILASHADVHGGGELDEMERVAGAVPVLGSSRLPYPEGVPALIGADLVRLGELYDARIRRRAPTSLRVTDKMATNFFYGGFIHLILPGARLIHCVRDAVDTCFSCYSTLFGPGNSWAYDFREIAGYQRCYERLMAHWKSVLPAGTMLEVSYEDVVADLEGQARRLVSHCGLEWDDACLEFHRTMRPVRTASMTQVRRPLYASSVGRWRNYERHLAPLLSELGRG